MKISLNNLLIIAVLMVLTVFFFSDKAGTYLSGSEPQIYLLILITLGTLVINLYFKNDFISVLNLVFVPFYICRIPFVFSENIASDVLSRGVDIRSIPWSLTILIFQYLSLVICIFLINPRIPRKKIGFLSEQVFKRIFAFASIIVLVNALNAFFFWKYGAGAPSHFLGILQSIFPLDYVLMMILLAAVMGWGNISVKYKTGVILLCSIVVVCFSFLGSKSGLLQVMLLASLALIVVSGPIVFRMRTLLLTVSLVLVSFVLYFVGSAFKFYQRGQIDANEIVDTSFNSNNTLSMSINGFGYRIGYLDFFLDKISNPVYRPFVDFRYYFMSLTDKMTPGFDVFDVPFQSRAIYNAYHGVSTEGTNSEEVTIFAESHLLFGFFSFFLFGTVLFIMAQALLRYRAASGFAYGLFYVYVISIFYSWVVGFGLDMLISEAIFKGIFVFFITWVARVMLGSQSGLCGKSEQVIRP